MRGHAEAIAVTATASRGGDFWTTKVLPLFARNTAASFVAFAFDMALLWAMVELALVQPFPAAAAAFVAAISLHYVLCRIWVFRGTERSVGEGYVYFLLNSLVGLALTMSLFAALSEMAGLHYLTARVVASVFAGIAVFFLNAVLNFRSL